MILIADSGSTKTDWRIVNDNGAITSVETIGFNPYFIDAEGVVVELESSDLVAIKTKVKQVFFYGAGCSSKENCTIISIALNSFFTASKIEVSHDMLAAARATCRNDKGMVAILGTGSNSCLYNGNSIVENVTALGYVLGDNGSGADIGKTFIKAFLGKDLPKELDDKFTLEYKLSSADILNGVYKQALPNRYLAGFNLFVYQHLNHPFFQQLVTKRFELFFEKNICKYTDYQKTKLHLVGSIAFVYQDILIETAKKYHVNLGKIIKQPIDELVQYHL